MRGAAINRDDRVPKMTPIAMMSANPNRVLPPSKIRGISTRSVIPEVISGHKIAALAITEPSGGSDVAGIKTRAVSEGEKGV